MLLQDSDIEMIEAPGTSSGMGQLKNCSVKLSRCDAGTSSSDVVIISDESGKFLDA